MSQLSSALPFSSTPNLHMPITSLKTSSGTVVVDFLEPDCQLLTLTGNVSFSHLNTHAGLAKSIFLTGGGSSFTLTLPGNWILLGGLTSPITVAASKRAVLCLSVIGVNDASSATTSSVWVGYSVES